MLSQKTWDGRKLIAEAFQDAKEVQRRQGRDTAPKYANEPRSRLRLIVAKQQSEILALREQLDRVRAAQYDEIPSTESNSRAAGLHAGRPRLEKRRSDISSNS